MTYQGSIWASELDGLEQGKGTQSHPGGLGIARQAGKPCTTWTDATLVSMRIVVCVGMKGGELADRIECPEEPRGLREFIAVGVVLKLHVEHHVTVILRTL